MLADTLPRLRLSPGSDPLAAFPFHPEQLWLEIGFGGGEHLQALATAHPGVGLIGCEVFENGICSLLSRLAPEGAEREGALPANLRLWDGDARILLRLLPDGCLSRIFLLFPDPWPKSRHAKRRFVQAANIALLSRVLCPGGEWRIASDEPTYQQWVEARMAEAGGLFHAQHRSAIRPEGWPPTRYEAKALRAGRTPAYWSFCRKD